MYLYKNTKSPSFFFVQYTIFPVEYQDKKKHDCSPWDRDPTNLKSTGTWIKMAFLKSPWLMKIKSAFKSTGDSLKTPKSPWILLTAIWLDSC